MYYYTSKASLLKGWVTLELNIRFKGYIYRQYIYTPLYNVVDFLFGSNVISRYWGWLKNRICRFCE